MFVSQIDLVRKFELNKFNLSYQGTVVKDRKKNETTNFQVYVSGSIRINGWSFIFDNSELDNNKQKFQGKHIKVCTRFILKERNQFGISRSISGGKLK